MTADPDVLLRGVLDLQAHGSTEFTRAFDPCRIVEAIEAVGPEHRLLSSDAIENGNPPEPEVMRMFIATTLALGVPADDVYLMTHDNPARVLGLDRDGQPPAPDQVLAGRAT